MTRNSLFPFPSSDRTHSPSMPVLDRRRLVGWATGLGVMIAASHAGLGTAQPVVARQRGQPSIPTGHTWLLDAPDALRPGAPGNVADAEIQELIDLQADRTDEMIEQVDHWGGRRAVLPWLELGLKVTADTFPPGLNEVRAQALLRTAMNDAVVAAIDAQAAHNRPPPAATDERIIPIGNSADSGASFPSLHATVAGAASTVLAYLFPDASPDDFTGMANEAATSRLWAGTSYRSDIEAGLALGQAIGERAVTRGKEDGSDAEWDGTGWPTGEKFYKPTPPTFADPLEPLGGTWTTWVLPSGSAIRPAPFPEYGSLAWNAELAQVRRATEQRTLAQERIIDFWLSKGPNGYYTGYAQDVIERENLGEAEAASLLAMISVAQYDALVAVWDAKYHYWIARPITMDPSLDLYVPNPPYPSYPGGFGAACGAGATVLADAFPASEVELLTSASEAAAQRGWAGIHYVLDDDVALMMGCQVGRMTFHAAHESAGE